jgi:hypothetical protein
MRGIVTADMGCGVMSSVRAIEATQIAIISITRSSQKRLYLRLGTHRSRPSIRPVVAHVLVLTLLYTAFCCPQVPTRRKILWRRVGDESTEDLGF